jgi:hypothetical protein
LDLRTWKKNKNEKKKIILRREGRRKQWKKRGRGEFDLYVTSKGERSLAQREEKTKLVLPKSVKRAGRYRYARNVGVPRQNKRKGKEEERNAG